MRRNARNNRQADSKTAKANTNRWPEKHKSSGEDIKDSGTSRGGDKSGNR